LEEEISITGQEEEGEEGVITVTAAQFDKFTGLVSTASAAVATAIKGPLLFSC